jgi:hypothetical protein
MRTDLQQAALVTRDAYASLLDLKNLVERVTEEIRIAEREAVGIAIGRYRVGEPLKKLRDAAESLKSAGFEAAISEARTKTQSALDLHVGLEQA